MTEHEELFLDTILDLERKAALADRYALVKASGLLRLLLLDGRRLVDQVNRSYGVSIRFETIDYTMKPPFADRIFFRWSSLDASPFPGAMKRTSTIDEFLGADLLTFEGRDFTVRDVIRAAAHVKGGIHAGVPEDEHEQALLNFDRVLVVGGLDASVAALRSIVTVTLRALQPLVEAVRARGSQ